MRFVRAAAIVAAVAFAGSSAGIATANAASIAVGKKLELKVNPKDIGQEQARLWEKFGGWCALKDWHPAVVSCQESTENGAQVRVLTLKDGSKIKEKLLDKKPNFYRYEMLESQLPVKNYQAQFSLVPDDDDEDEINFSWSATFDANGKTNKEARDVIDGIFKAGLDNIKMMVGPKAADQDDKK
jgi:hypothetical protein